MNAPAPKKIRCAIYTRKSSEEGLDQAFNSLDAQREACEAYVTSQSGEGWALLATHYDDGGYSGGTLERPALQALLADITAGKIDTVVVYKIDRLTRSLADFAKIVERLDAAGASFVSVTQAFNTTTSMGRLTLNVLLSFPQFEREVTGERIRDKIAASKAKGMWMGGNLPVGYDRPDDPATRALVVNETEATAVRLIFEKYLELGSVSTLEAWLANAGIRSKAYVNTRGREVGGMVFSRGALFHLLKNRVYLGEITHKDASYPGRHKAILEAELFEKTQALMSAHRIAHRDRPTRASTASLRGLIFDAEGHPMSPTCAFGDRAQVYRYYVSAPLQQGRALAAGDDAIRRIPAQAIEDLVLDRLTRLAQLTPGAGAWPKVRSILRRIDVQATSMHLLLDVVGLCGAKSSAENGLAKVRPRLIAGELASSEEEGVIRIVLPVRMKVRGGRTWLTTPEGRDLTSRTKVDRVLVKALRTAHGLARTNGLDGAAKATKAPGGAYDRKLCLLAFLAPDIQDAVLEGRQPASLTLERLVHEDIPLAWTDQREALGF